MITTCYKKRKLLIRHTRSIVNYGFAMHFRAIENFLFATKQTSLSSCKNTSQEVVKYKIDMYSLVNTVSWLSVMCW